MKTRFGLTFAIAAVTAALASPPRANADDLLKLTIGQRGNWDTAITQLGTKAGIFKKNGIELEMVYTSGSGETLQPVIGGAVDLGLAVGTLGAIAAYAKGAPVRIIGAQATGAADYWYAKTSSPVKKLADLTDKNTIAFSTNGSSTNSIVRAFIDEFKLKVKPMSTGNPLIVAGSRSESGISRSGYFTRTRIFTARMPVVTPSVTFSPMPTPTTFCSGFGLAIGCSAASADISAGGGRRLFESSCFALRSRRTSESANITPSSACASARAVARSTAPRPAPCIAESDVRGLLRSDGPS